MTRPQRVVSDSLHQQKWLDAAFAEDEIDDVAIDQSHESVSAVLAMAADLDGADYEFTAIYRTTIYYVFDVGGRLVGLMHPSSPGETGQ